MKKVILDFSVSQLFLKGYLIPLIPIDVCKPALLLFLSLRITCSEYLLNALYNYKVNFLSNDL